MNRITLNKAQQLALKSVYDRTPLVRRPGEHPRAADNYPHRPRLTYRDFRRLVTLEFGRDPAAIVPWCGMWLGIEPDGYTHS